MTNATAQAASRESVHFVYPREFLAELEADLQREAVVDRIVRLVICEGIATIGMIESDFTPGADRKVPYDVARSHFVECAYVSSRSELVKLSDYIGFTWTNPGEKAGRVTHNEEVRQKSSGAVRLLQDALARLAVEVRGGGLHVDDGKWSAFPDQVIESPAPERCRFCDEAIHYANNAWRHTATKRAEATREVRCEHCSGGHVTVGGRDQLCPRCHGSMTLREEDHLATAAEAEEVSEGGQPS